MKYQLAFEGSAGKLGYKFPRFRKSHSTIESAEAEALRVWQKLDEIIADFGRGTVSACHAPVIYGPGCGDSGRPVRMRPR